MSRVFVAMSGGVDSSVAAALLLEEGHAVTGVTMDLMSPATEGACCPSSALADASRVCERLGISHLVLDMRDSFEQHVLRPFADAYAAGLTPNPCIDCNALVKFGDLLSRVLSEGAEYLATGHYARIERDESGSLWLARGVDRDKDQSYFLYRLAQDQMCRVVFPLGGLQKPDVRAYARALGLPVAEKRESQEVCFAPAGQHSEVVRRWHPESVEGGPIVDRGGKELGRHSGLANYTVGQRKGLGVASREPLYVLALDSAANRLVVGTRSELVVEEVTATDVVWRGEDEVVADVVIRYRMSPVQALVSRTRTGLTARFREPLHGVAPGQSIVCYVGERVLGGGVIACAG